MRSACLFVLVLLSSTVGSQTQPVSNDGQSIDAIVAALYDVISGPAGQKRDWDRFRALFTKEGRLLAAVKTRTGDIRLVTMTPEDYIKGSAPYLESKGFFEKELARRMETYGSIANVFSTYASRNKASDKEPFERGINNIELFHDGKRWWIVSIYWQGEDTGVKLPAKYLKSG